MLPRLAVSLSICLVWVASALGESHLMRFADVHGDRVVFTYEGDLWLASTAGGDARRITSDKGEERFAKFSPDGRQIAFTAGYDGGVDVYVMDAGGGVPRRLTWHPAADLVLDWYPDGQSILFRSRRAYPFRAEELYRVSVAGGMEERLPVDRGGLASLSPDGKSIVYNRISREFATWKRYRGGMAQDLWVGNLESCDYRKITDWPGTDNFPMWATDGIYFVSDRAHGTLNLFKHDLKTNQVTQLTDYRDYDVRYPSLGPGQIVYQYAESLYLFDLAAAKSRKLEVNIPSDRVKMRPGYINAAAHLGSFRLSPTGKRLLLETRGEIINMPVREGEPINLTRTSGSREKNAVWSPDGRWVCFISDRTGEEELFFVDQKGESEWRQVTQGGLGFRAQPVWSPDSKWLLFSDKFMKLNLVDAATGAIAVIDQGEYDDGWERWGIQDYVWSPDSRWIAYAKQEQNLNQSIFLYSLVEQKVHRVTSDLTQDSSPSFDPQRRYLYFLSERTYSPIMGFEDQNFIMLDMCRPYVVVLERGKPSPFAPRDSEEPVKEAEQPGAAAASDEPAGRSNETAAATREPETKPAAAAESGQETKCVIDVGDFDRRTFAVEGIPAGNYFRLEAAEKGFFYLKKEEHEFSKYQSVTDTTGGSLDLYFYELEPKEPDKRQPKKLMSGISNYHLSADGKKLVYKGGGGYGVVDAGTNAAVGDGKVDLGRIKIRIDRDEEFRQMFDEAWRIQRDWFYDPNLHGVDWSAVGEKYRRFVPFCGNRSDLNYLIGEMISELNAGHTYVSGGDFGDGGQRVSTGLLGADFVTPPGAAYHQFAHIVPGNNWDPAEQSPLAAPDCPIRPGDYLIAIDGQEVKSSDNIYRHLENKLGKVVTLTYNTKPSADGAKTYRARTIGGEEAIRYREWVDNNRAAVARASNGAIGYVHIPDMGESGLIEFSKAWHAQHTRQGMIVDARYNGGGFTGDMIIDRMERRLWALTQPREGKTIRDPERVFHGHIVVLINEDTGSNGEYFSEAIKIKGLGTVIGMRTWGGAVGIEPHQNLVDGGGTTPPQFAPFGLCRKWLIEGHGVEPDIEVQNMPGEVVKGRDAQLEAGLKFLLDKIEKEPMKIPETPPYPDKSKKAEFGPHAADV